MKNKLKYSFVIIMCIILQVNLNAQDALTADITYPTYNHHCQNGKIDLHIFGGHPPYDVVWTRTIWRPGSPPFEYVVQQSYGIQGMNDGEDIMNAMTGRYTVTVTDALCQTASKSFYLICMCSEDCTLDAEVVDAHCGLFGEIHASIDCQEDGHEPFTYRWDDENQNGSPDRMFLTPGTYCLTAKDKSKCEYRMCWEVKNIGSAPSVKLVAKKNIETCEGSEDERDCNGSLTISVAQGAVIDWQNIPNSSERHSKTVTDLCAGKYTVTVSIGGCPLRITKSFLIECCSTFDPNNPNESEITPISVSGKANSYSRSITLNVTGGGNDIHYSWTGPNGYSSNSKNISGLEPGIYWVRVFDGCTESIKRFEIVDCEANPIMVSASTEETCYGVAAGIITLHITGGGSPPYTVTWDNGMTGASINNLPEGTYCAIVTSESGCKSENLCYTIGAKSGTISTSTRPCTRTVHCNGSDYIEYFDYEKSLDCNTVTYYCRVSGGSFDIDYGWYDTYILNCDLWGVCWDGRHILIQEGRLERGPFGVKKQYNCPHHIGCVDYACYIPGYGHFIKKGTTVYCSTVFYEPDDRCGTDQCWAKVYCGETLIAEGCVDYDCSFALKKDDINIADELGLPHLTEIGNLKEIVNTKRMKNIAEGQKSSKSIKGTKVTSNKSNKLQVEIHPNPSNGVLEIKFKDVVEGFALEVFDIVGHSVYSSESKETLYKTSVDLSSLSAGIYFIYLSDKLGNLSVQRVIIE